MSRPNVQDRGRETNNTGKSNLSLSSNSQNMQARERRDARGWRALINFISQAQCLGTTHNSHPATTLAGAQDITSAWPLRLITDSCAALRATNSWSRASRGQFSLILVGGNLNVRTNVCDLAAAFVIYNCIPSFTS